MIDFLDSGVRTNDITDEYFSNAEAWRADSGIVSYTIPNFTQPGEYHLDNALFVQNSTGVDRLRGTTISFSPIPEPTAPLLVGIAGTLGLLRRKRNNTDTTKNSAS